MKATAMTDHLTPEIIAARRLRLRQYNSRAAFYECATPDKARLDKIIAELPRVKRTSPVHDLIHLLNTAL